MSDNLNRFVAGYIECLLWTSADDLPQGVDASDIPEGQTALIVRECAAFIAKARGPLATATSQPGYSWERAGHDFWLTRNRHGAGFWDRDELSQRTRDALTSWAHGMAEVSAYLGDDGKVYLQ